MLVPDVDHAGGFQKRREFLRRASHRFRAVELKVLGQVRHLTPFNPIRLAPFAPTLQRRS
jgi:hypothetical protein